MATNKSNARFLGYFEFTWNMFGVVALLKLRALVRWTSGSYFAAYPLIMTVLAVPCSPISSTDFSCLRKCDINAVIFIIQILTLTPASFSFFSLQQCQCWPNVLNSIGVDQKETVFHSLTWVVWSHPCFSKIRLKNQCEENALYK